MGETQLDQAPFGSNTYGYGSITFCIGQQLPAADLISVNSSCPGLTRASFCHVCRWMNIILLRQ